MANTVSRLVLALLAGSFLLGGAAGADRAAPPGAEAGPGIHVPSHPRVNHVNRRQRREQRRIAHGIANGSLNPNEAARLQRAEDRIQQEESADLAQHHGHLTRKEKRKLNREENRLSHEISKERHDAN